ncbi:MAG TPA: acyl-CoA dehydrogenase [Pseudomonadales bacterium]
MDFNDTPTEAAFRQEVRAFLDGVAPLRQHPSDTAFVEGRDDGAAVAIAKQWQATLFDAGWACLGWPKEYGGRGAAPIERVIWSQEVSRYVTPDGFFVIGQGMCGPTLMAYANDEQKRHYLPALARGDDIWCQLFSEPVAGSDLAGIKTRAERVGDDWVLNGQKIWTSGAHYSDFGIIVTRTDPNVPKHKGLTMFFIDMKSPGIDIRPIKQINGDRAFNEVFFTDVRVPDSQRLGAVGAGWQVSLVTLMNERLAVGGSLATSVEPLLELASTLKIDGKPALANPAVRERLAGWYAQLAGLKYTGFRMVSALSRGATPGPEASISKVVVARMNQDMANFALDLQSLGGILDSPKLTAMQNQFQRQFMRSPANRIEGGSDEILRNIIAERVLGLPPDIRVDKDLPFSAVPKN